MGMLFSCPVEEEKDVPAEAPLPAPPGRGNAGEPAVLKPPMGSGKLRFEGSLILQREQQHQQQSLGALLQAETKISVASPRATVAPVPTMMPRELARTRFADAAAASCPAPESPKHESAAVTVQKVYKSFRTRRRLADCAVLVEQSWCVPRPDLHPPPPAQRHCAFLLLKRPSPPLQVGAAGFRAAQAELRLLLRHREAGVRGVQVGEGKNQSCQGLHRRLASLHTPANLSLLLSSKSFDGEVGDNRTDGICKFHRIQVGKGLSKDDKAQKLALQHWLEAVSISHFAGDVFFFFFQVCVSCADAKCLNSDEQIDPRHRYGHNLHYYYDCWLRCESKEPFFYWLVSLSDHGVCIM
jgi:hypothetical protein